MGVYTRGNKLWISFKDVDGKWRNVSTGCSVGQESEAERMLVDIKAMVAERRTAIPESDDFPQSMPPKTRLTQKIVDGLTVPEGSAQLILWDTEVAGFGVVVGKQVRTFVVNARVDGRKVRTKIGISGRLADDGRIWNVTKARHHAINMLASMARGTNPNIRPHQLPSGKWRIRWIDANGERKSTTFPTREQAESAIPQATTARLERVARLRLVAITDSGDEETLCIYKLKEIAVDENREFQLGRECFGVWVARLADASINGGVF